VTVPTLFAANESQVLVAGNAVEGVRSIDYRRVQARENVYGLGSHERIGLVGGAQLIEGVLRVASTAPALDALTTEQNVQISAVLVHGATRMTVTFDECFLQEKSFEMSSGGHGLAVYAFTATRMREELAAAATPA
jgi:hypothetical protein